MPKHPLQEAREAMMVSKAELARRTGLSVLTIGRIEAGRDSRVATRRRILEALGIPLDKRETIFATDALAAGK